MSYIIHRPMPNDMNVQAALPGAEEARTRFCIDQYARVPRFEFAPGDLPTHQYELVERFELLMDKIYGAVEALTHPKPRWRPNIVQTTEEAS